MAVFTTHIRMDLQEAKIHPRASVTRRGLLQLQFGPCLLQARGEKGSSSIADKVYKAKRSRDFISLASAKDIPRNNVLSPQGCAVRMNWGGINANKAVII